jgi:(S)-ureidoglycine aminohydrolase
MRNVTAVVHIAPPAGAKFLQYTAEFETGGELLSVPEERFVYVLEGELHCPGQGLLKPGSFAYFPPDYRIVLTAAKPSRSAVIERKFIPHQDFNSPDSFFGHEDQIAGQPLMGDPDLIVQTLVPASAAYDFAVNLMTYQPGATLPMVEIHVMEHGLLMLNGAGIYKLNDSWYPTSAGDFIWMGPYCPQWFGALGKQPARYLIYKDWNRNPLA